jgi:hypothetical protein
VTLPASESELVWENILETDVELFEHRFQFFDGQMMLTAFKPVERSVRDANLLGELGVRKSGPSFLQKSRKLPF